jgi:hypothetical protein
LAVTPAPLVPLGFDAARKTDSVCVQSALRSGKPLILLVVAGAATQRCRFVCFRLTHRR